MVAPSARVFTPSENGSHEGASRAPLCGWPSEVHPALARFSPAAAAWFGAAFAAPTAAQTGAWDAIASGQHALVSAPTGSGKTLAAFLWALDRLAVAPRAREPGRPRPLRLAAEGARGRHRAEPARAAGGHPRRGGPARARASRASPPRCAPATRPPRSAGGWRSSRPTSSSPRRSRCSCCSRPRRATRCGPSRRSSWTRCTPSPAPSGAPIWRSASSASTASCARPAQRIGLSATVRPLEEVARFLGGAQPVAVVAAPADKRFDLSIVVPVEDLARIGAAGRRPVPSGSASGAEERSSVWPHVEERLLELIRAHRSTIVFANSRRLAERLCARLNELASEEVVRAHHGSVSREQRAQIEEALRAGRIPAVVATSSLELGIDMGAVDLVVQVEAPDSVATGAPAHRTRRAPGGRGEPRSLLPEVPRRPPRVRGRRRAHARRRDRGAALRRATRSTSSRSRSSRWWPWTTGPSTGSSASCGAPPRSPSCRARRSTACSTCSPVAIPPTSSPSCARASTGTAPRSA